MVLLQTLGKVDPKASFEKVYNEKMIKQHIEEVKQEYIKLHLSNATYG
jgi:hypothetical protein